MPGVSSNTKINVSPYIFKGIVKKDNLKNLKFWKQESYYFSMNIQF